VTAYSILFYDYVDGIVQLRAPHREEHLRRIAAAREEGEVVMAGALGDPPHGAAFVFAEGVSLERIEAFVVDDPYVKAGLVTGHRVEPWNVITAP
jgi:uncharacterized protein YciI